MSRPFSRFLALSAIGLLCFQLTLAQQTNSTTADKNADAARKETELRDKAYELLSSLADQISTLQSAENRARMGSNIAGSLWPHDEKRARALFKLVEDDIALGLQVQKADPNADHTFQVFYKLRENTAERMAQHDPDLALAFVKATASFVDDYARLPSGGFLPLVIQQEQALELRLAKRVGAANPDVAIKLARQSLAHGFSTDLLSVLKRSNKDNAQVSALYKEIVAKLRDADFDEWQTREFAQALATNYTPPAGDEATFRELIQIFVTKAIANGCTRPKPDEYDQHTAFCLQMGMLLPVIEKFYPLEARRLKHWAADPRESEYQYRTGYSELEEVAQEGSIEDVLALASKYPELDVAIWFRAMWMAESVGDWEQAEKIANRFNGNPQARQSLAERVKYYKRFTVNAEQQWETALKQANQLPLSMQVTALMVLAAATARQNNSMALKMLAHISNLVDALPPGAEQTERQIDLATVYCLANSDRGFAIMEGLLPKLNELIAAGAKLDGYDARYLRDGEWNMTAEGVVGKILTALANNAGYFAWNDFDRAVTLAGQFERAEIRMMAQLKLAQGILAGQAKRFPSAPSRIRIIN
jgi:hypothetical protein